MGKDLAVWATANPLAAIAIIGSLSGGSIGILIALAKALPPLAAALRAYRSKNGNGNGHEQPTRQDATLPPGRLELVTREVLDIELGGQWTHIQALEEGMTGKGGTQERLAVVEATCARVETEVKALPAAFQQMLQAQTVQLQESNRKHMLAAFEALEKQTDARIAAALAQRGA